MLQCCFLSCFDEFSAVQIEIELKPNSELDKKKSVKIQCHQIKLCCNVASRLVLTNFLECKNINLNLKKMREMTHCCCCVPLPDGVMLVGVYGTAFHTGLLVIQVSF